HAQLRPQGRELPRDLMEAGAPSRDRGAIDRPRRGAGDDGEGGRTVAKCRDLTDPLEHPRLVRTPGATGRQHESEHRKAPGHESNRSATAQAAWERRRTTP